MSKYKKIMAKLHPDRNDTDTTKLKRVSPSTQNINLDGENYTDTVHLKVIKERKKQLSGILTASQTIRLRPPSAGTKAPEITNTDSTVMTQELKLPPQKNAASTLKVADPSSTDTGTIKVSGPASAGTLRVKAPVMLSHQLRELYVFKLL